MRPHVTSRLLALASCYYLLTSHASACAISYLLVDVNPSFHVLVKHGNQPISGIGVAVYGTRGTDRELEDKPFLHLVSDKNGTINVASLKPGTYFIATEGTGQGSAFYAVLGDKRRSKAKDEVSLEWPARTVIRTKHLAGKLLDANDWSTFEMSLANAELELWKPGTLTPIAKQTISREGRFEFQTTAPGLYILRLKGGFHEGEIGLDLSPASSDAVDEVKLHLTETSCGLMYQQCPAWKPLELRSSNLTFLEATGKPWQRAAYRLERRDGALVAQGSTDENGKSALSEILAGEFRLVLAKPANSVEQLVRFNRGSAVGYSSGLALIVQFDGVCSYLSLEKHAP